MDMENSGQTPQFSVSELFSSLMASPIKLAATAAGCVFLALFLPAVSVSGSAFGINGGSTSVSGVGVAGFTAWLTFLAFAGAAISRLNVGITQYRKLLDQASFGMFVITTLWAFFGGPIASEMKQISNVQGQVSGFLGTGNASMIASVSVYPSIGVVLFVMAPVALFLAKKRERAA